MLAVDGHGPVESSLLMVRLRVSSSSDVVNRVLVLFSSTWLCLFKRMHLTASSKTRMEVCTYKKGVFNNPSLRYFFIVSTNGVARHMESPCLSLSLVPVVVHVVTEALARYMYIATSTASVNSFY